MRDKIVNDTDTIITSSNDSVITYNKIINVTNTISISSDEKIVRYNVSSYISHTVFLVIILLLLFVAICFHCIKDRTKQKIFSVQNFYVLSLIKLMDLLEIMMEVNM